jgi:hypothetical protein
MAPDSEERSVGGADADMAAESELLGLIGCGELFAFETLARDSALARTLDAKAALGAIACREYNHFAMVSARLIEMGEDPEESIGAYVPILTEFHRKTAPRDLLEGLMKAYVGHGISADFGREISRYVSPDTRQFVGSILSDDDRTDLIVSYIQKSLKEDPGAAGRLALWGRRLMGEALAQAQRVAADRPDLARIVLDGSVGNESGHGFAEFAGMLARLTEAHSERMQGLGLAP